MNGELSNYRHDAKESLRWAYTPENEAAKDDEEYDRLQGLCVGLAGGSECGRRGFLYKEVDLPQVEIPRRAFGGGRESRQ